MWTFNKNKSVKPLILLTPGLGRQYRVYDYNEHDEKRLYLEFFLKRLWFNNKGEDNVFSFERINIRTKENPYYIDAIKFDVSAQTTMSLNVFFSTATDDHLLFHETNKNSFIEAPVFRTAELMNLVYGLQEQDYVLIHTAAGNTLLRTRHGSGTKRKRMT